MVRNTHINFLWLLFILVGKICPPLQEHFLRLLLKCKVLLVTKKTGLRSFNLFSKVSPGSENLKITKKRFSLVKECDGFLQCFVMLGPAHWCCLFFFDGIFKNSLG